MKHLDLRRSTVPQRSQNSEHQLELRPGFDSSDLVQQLSAKLRDAKIAQQVAAQAKVHVEEFLEEQTRRWQKEKREIHVRFENECQQLSDQLKEAHATCATQKAEAEKEKQELLQRLGDECQQLLQRLKTLQARYEAQDAEHREEKIRMCKNFAEERQKLQQQLADLHADLGNERQSWMQQLAMERERLASRTDDLAIRDIQRRLRHDIGTQTYDGGNMRDELAASANRNSPKVSIEIDGTMSPGCFTPQRHCGVREGSSWPSSGTPRNSLLGSNTGGHGEDGHEVGQDLYALGLHLNRCFGTAEAVVDDLRKAQLPAEGITAEFFEKELLDNRWGASRLVT